MDVVEFYEKARRALEGQRPERRRDRWLEMMREQPVGHPFRRVIFDLAKAFPETATATFGPAEYAIIQPVIASGPEVPKAEQERRAREVERHQKALEAYQAAVAEWARAKGRLDSFRSRMEGTPAD